MTSTPQQKSSEQIAKERATKRQRYTSSSLFFLALVALIYSIYVLAKPLTTEQQLMTIKENPHLLDSVADSIKMKIYDTLSLANRDRSDLYASTIHSLDSIIKSNAKPKDESAAKFADSVISDSHIKVNAIDAKQMQLLSAAKIIYIQVNDRQSLSHMKRAELIAKLNEKGYKAFGYEIMKGKCDNTVRYFHAEDRAAIDQIIADVNKITGITLTGLFTKGYEKIVPQGQYELWIKGN